MARTFVEFLFEGLTRWKSVENVPFLFPSEIPDERRMYRGDQKPEQYGAGRIRRVTREPARHLPMFHVAIRRKHSRNPIGLAKTCRRNIDGLDCRGNLGGRDEYRSVGFGIVQDACEPV